MQSTAFGAQSIPQLWEMQEINQKRTCDAYKSWLQTDCFPYVRKLTSSPIFFSFFFFLPSLAAFHLLDWKMQSTWGEYFSGKWYKGYGMLLLVVLRLHSSIQCDCQRKRNNKTTWKQFCWQNTASLLKYNKERNNTIFKETKVSGTWKLSIKNVWIMCYCFPREEQ